MFFALTLSSLGSIAVFLPRFLERPFYLTLFLKSQNYLFVFLFIQFPMTFLSAMSLDMTVTVRQLAAGGLKLCRVTLRFFRLYFV